jgi:hypothetical protein
MAEQGYRVQINNEARLRAMLRLLDETAREIDATNPNNIPIQFHVKQRWAEACHVSLAYFLQFLPGKDSDADTLPS